MIEAKTKLAQSAISDALSRQDLACVTSSFQSECVVLVHMIRQQKPDIPVLFLETGYHFPETLEYRDRLTAEWKLNLRNLAAAQSVADQEAQFGILNQTAPDQCCKLRKVGPLFAGLSEYETWFTALRKEQSKTRASLQVVEPFKLHIQDILLRGKVWHQYREAVGHATQVTVFPVRSRQVLWRQPILAFGRTRACERNQLGQIPVSLTILGEEDETERR